MSKLKEWLFSNRPNNLLTIILALLGVIGSYFGARSGVSSTIKVDQNQNQNLTQNQTNNITTDVLSASDTKIDTSSGVNFDPDKWIFSVSTSSDKEGFYCPNGNSFPSWFIWTKNRYLPNKPNTVTFILLDKTKNDKNPSFYLTYGDKSNSAPEQFYRLNIFDGDASTIRLYDNNDEEVLYDRSSDPAPTDKYITLKLDPVFPNIKSVSLLLNPTVSYQIDGKIKDLNLQKEFKTNLPIPSIESMGEGFQFGIGVSKGDCFKIISSTFEN